MRDIGFTNATIGVMAAAYSGVMLLAETPSGILADRWSRKGVLILGSIALVVSSWICGISNSVPMYLIGAMFWGVFYALYSGTYDSIVYDTLLEEKGHVDDYEKYYGRVRVFESAALVSSSLLGGLLGEALDLRAAFYWTIPAALLSIVPLLLFREPVLHRAETETPLSSHVREMFAVVLRRGALTQILLAVVGATLAMEILYEFTQLWYIAIAMPIALFGVANALILAAPGVAGVIVAWASHRWRIGLLLALGMIATLGLTIEQSSWFIMTCQTILALSLTAVSIAFNKRMHNQLPSKVRAGASSAISTLSRLLFIPLAAAFGFISNSHSTFIAGWILVGIVAVAYSVGFTIFAKEQTGPKITT